MKRTPVILLFFFGACKIDDTHPVLPPGDLSGFVEPDLGGGHDLRKPADLKGATGDMMGEEADLLEQPDMVGGTCSINSIVINEVQTGGQGGASDEWIELFNPCSDSVALTGAKLVYRGATGTTDTNLSTLSGNLASGAFFLAAGSSYSGNNQDVSFSSNLASTGGGIALKDSGGNIVDSVGYGTATNAFIEGMVAPAPASGKSIGRTNGVDSNNNANDFTVRNTPTPKAAN